MCTRPSTEADFEIRDGEKIPWRKAEPVGHFYERSPLLVPLLPRAAILAVILDSEREPASCLSSPRSRKLSAKVSYRLLRPGSSVARASDMHTCA
jgi:hypothetical protein